MSFASWSMQIGGDKNPLQEIKTVFQQLAIGGTLNVIVPHRDMNPQYEDVPCLYLPDRAEPPYTFSLKQTITDALNAICPQAPDNFEELPEDVQKALSNESEGQGMWKFIELKIEENDIIAVVKKL